MYKVQLNVTAFTELFARLVYRLQCSWFVYAPFLTGRKQTDYPTDKPRGHANDFLNANWKPYKAETSASRVDKPATPLWSG